MIPMRTIEAIIVASVMAAGCNYVAQWDDRGPKIVASMGVDPDAVSSDKATTEKAQDGATKKQTTGASTNHEEKSKAELQAEKDQNLQWIGILICLSGVGYYVARFYFPLLPTYGGVMLLGLGAGCVAWASLAPSARHWIFVGAGVVAIGAVVYSIRHNKKLRDLVPGIRPPAG